MRKRRSRQEIALERARRRRDIRRGVKIGLYEANQRLASTGFQLHYPKSFPAYTVALAEGNRRGATVADRIAAALWQRAAALGLLR